jgi:hypothetical protein
LNAPLEKIYFYRDGAWTVFNKNMSDLEKPIGSPSDFGHLSPFEREKQEAIRRAAMAPSPEADDPEHAFRQERARIDAMLAKAAEGRKRLEAGEPEPVAEPVATAPKLFHLLCSKSADKKIRVVGMYSNKEALAQGIADGVAAYAAAGQVLGTVEFDLNIKVNQPPVAP